MSNVKASAAAVRRKVLNYILVLFMIFQYVSLNHLYGQMNSKNKLYTPAAPPLAY